MKIKGTKIIQEYNIEMEDKQCTYKCSINTNPNDLKWDMNVEKI